MSVEEPSNLLEEGIMEKIDGEVGFEEVSGLNVEIREPNEQIGSSTVSSGVDVEVKEEMEPIRSPQVDGDGTGENCEPRLPEVGPSAPVAKGYGLKKWRRIRRGSNSDGSPSKDSSPMKCSSPGSETDSSVIYKRRLSHNEPRNLKNNVEVAIEPPVPSGGSLRSVEAVTVDSELVHLVTSFSIGMDSDNSEERRSTSSTAASVPKARHEIGFGRERVRLKNLGGREQRVQKGREGGVDSGKKFRGDRLKLGKENSQSSVESNKFAQRKSGVSNEKQSDNSLNLEGEHSDEAQTYGEVQSGYYKENGGFEDLPREDFDAEHLEENIGKSEMFRPPSGIDPFIESIVLLQTAQEALETEIQRIEEIRNEASVEFEETELCSIPSSVANLFQLHQEKELLQRKLEEALATAHAKELNVRELEDIIKRTQLVKRETHSTCLPLLDEMHRTLEFELESLLRAKIEAEIQFLIIARTIQSWKVLTEDRIALFEEQKSLSGDHAQVTIKLKEAENKVTELKDRADELDAHCKILLQTEKTWKMQKKVCKISLCLCLQLLLLCVAFGLFLIQMLPQPHDIVPT